PEQLTNAAREIERNRLLEREAGRPWAERRLGSGRLERLDRRSPRSALHVHECEVPIGRANHHIRTSPLSLVEHSQRQQGVAAQANRKRKENASSLPRHARQTTVGCSEGE